MEICSGISTKLLFIHCSQIEFRSNSEVFKASETYNTSLLMTDSPLGGRLLFQNQHQTQLSVKVEVIRDVKCHKVTHTPGCLFTSAGEGIV